MSALIEETDLLYRKKYHWDRPASGGDEGLDRDSGEDILLFINDMLQANPMWGTPQARELEVMLRVYLPREIKHKEAVRRWVYQNREDLADDVQAIIIDLDDGFKLG